MQGLNIRSHTQSRFYMVYSNTAHLWQNANKRGDCSIHRVINKSPECNFRYFVKGSDDEDHDQYRLSVRLCYNQSHGSKEKARIDVS